MKIFIINGYAPHKYKGDHFANLARGKLARTIVDIMEDELSGDHELKITHIQDGYDKQEEQLKYKWADIIIMHTPVYWFYTPGEFKQYIDDVYVPGVFTHKSNGEGYGHSGSLNGKYLLSLTWNAPESAFQKEEFMEGDVDTIMLNLHKTNQYIGLKKLNTFSLHDVVKNPNIKEYEKKLRKHLREEINNEKNL